MKRIASRHYIDGSRGQPCTLQIPGVCDGGGETTVFAHIKDGHSGRGIKASDISGCDACMGCHAKFDGQSGAPLSAEDWLFYALRGLQRTLENRIARGLLILRLDIEPVTKPKSSKPIPNAKKAWPKRSFPSRKKSEPA